jgi:hypothetical protein
MQAHNRVSPMSISAPRTDVEAGLVSPRLSLTLSSSRNHATNTLFATHPALQTQGSNRLRSHITRPLVCWVTRVGALLRHHASERSSEALLHGTYSADSARAPRYCRRDWVPKFRRQGTLCTACLAALRPLQVVRRMNRSDASCMVRPRVLSVDLFLSLSLMLDAAQLGATGTPEDCL